MKRSLTAAATALTVAALLLAACGGSSTTASNSSTTAPSESTTTAPSGDPTPNTGPFTAEQLGNMLLRVSDFRPDFVRAPVPDATNGGATSSDPCLAGVNGIGTGHPGAKRGVISTTTGETFVEFLVDFGADSEHAYTTISTGFDSCSEVTLKSGGMSLTGTMTSLPYHQFGDESSAWRTTFDVGRQSIDQDTIVARYGPIVATMVFTTNHPADDHDLFENMHLAEYYIERGLSGFTRPESHDPRDSGGSNGSGGSSGSNGSADVHTA